MQDIKSISTTDRPRERLLTLGPGALSNMELLSILIGSGTRSAPLNEICGKLITVIDDQPAILAKMSIQELKQIKGIGKVKAIELTAALEFGKRAFFQNGTPLNLKTNKEAETFIRPYLEKQESIGYFLIMLNNRQELLATKEIGIVQNKPPSVKQLLTPALEAGATEFLVCRKTRMLPKIFEKKERAFILQLEAAAGMMTIKMRKLLIVDI
ncbi:hypothetical protein FO440_14380 [Mucilaginibacter corticis]|uniref:UPF0758 domain-containing protein n=1 Tax=Mucilaginibacter corticis TaxID=2597670 RepID=A0A556MLY4_9SPHI|nr:UPF0758 domain-containing protein [Mucilaginibacter corticis]TSJ40920.1 hypothetical protein FO440_14380 [Mucilaginibacter corticis]